MNIIHTFTTGPMSRDATGLVSMGSQGLISRITEIYPKDSTGLVSRVYRDLSPGSPGLMPRDSKRRIMNAVQKIRHVFLNDRPVRAMILPATGLSLARTILFAAVLAMFSGTTCVAQPGGKAYQFLEVTNSARVAGVGGTIAVLEDGDLNLPYHNPSLLNESMHHDVVVNYVNYFAGIHYGYAAFATRAGSRGTFSGGIHYLNYGSFQGADENGLLTGTFRAADYSVNLSYARPLDSLFSVGFTVKSIYSDLEAYKSTALAMDIGITYRNPARNFAAGLVIRNAGWQVSRYYPFGDREPLPLNISLGISQGLQHAPIRFSVVAEHLEKWDLTYESEVSRDNTTFNFTDEQPGKSGFDVFFDKLMRHMVFGAEVYPTKNVTLRAGYNYRRRQELKIESKPAMVGFSVGLGVHISRFQFDYGRSTYHLAGAVNYFSVSFNIDELNKKF